MAWDGPSAQDFQAIAAEFVIRPQTGNDRREVLKAIFKAVNRAELNAIPEDWFDRIAFFLVDASGSHDEPCLQELQSGLRELYAEVERGRSRAESNGDELLAWVETKARLVTLGQVCRGALERAVPYAAAKRVEPATHTDRVLRALWQTPGQSNSDLAEVLAGPDKEMDEGQVSRLLRRLLSQGLADCTRAGRKNSWELTPRGEALCGELRRRWEREEAEASVHSHAAVVTYATEDVTATRDVGDEIARHGYPPLIELLANERRFRYQLMEPAGESIADDAVMQVSVGV